MNYLLVHDVLRITVGEVEAVSHPEPNQGLGWTRAIWIAQDDLRIFEIRLFAEREASLYLVQQERVA